MDNGELEPQRTSYQKHLDRKPEREEKAKADQAERKLMVFAQDHLNGLHRLDEASRTLIRVEGHQLGIDDETIYRIFDKVESGNVRDTPTSEAFYSEIDKAMGVQPASVRSSMDKLDEAMGVSSRDDGDAPKAGRQFLGSF